jgi:hypothetical protein
LSESGRSKSKRFPVRICFLWPREWLIAHAPKAIAFADHRRREPKTPVTCKIPPMPCQVQAEFRAVPNQNQG